MSFTIAFIEEGKKTVNLEVSGGGWKDFFKNIANNLGAASLEKPFMAGVALMAFENGPDDTVFSGGFTGNPDLVVEMHADLIANLAMQSKNPKVFCGLICDKALATVGQRMREQLSNSEGIVVPKKKVVRP